MKQGLKLIIGSVALASTLIACGKKGSSSAAAAAAAAAYTNTTCTGSVAACNAYIGAGKWKGNVSVTNVANYRTFLVENGLCQNIQTLGVPTFRYDPRMNYNSCDRISNNYFKVEVQSATETVPGPMNFDIEARSNYQSGGRLSLARVVSRGRYGMIQADGVGISSGNGFNVVYQSLYNTAAYPLVRPYGLGVQPIAANPATVGGQLIISVQFVDAIRSIAQVTVSYKGLVIGQGQIRGLSADPLLTGTAAGAGLNAPTVAPYLDR